MDFLFYDFFVIYYDFSKIQLKFFKKEKDKTMFTVANSLQNRSREVKCTVWKVEGAEIPGFIVVGGKPNFDDNWRR